MLFYKRMLAFSGILLFALLLIGCGTTRYNDVVIPPMEEVEAMLAFISEDLQLSAEQASKVRLIIMENADIKQNIHQQYRGRPLDIREATEARLKKFDRTVYAILNEEQRELFPAMMRAVQRSEFADTPDTARSTGSSPADPTFDRIGGY